MLNKSLFNHHSVITIYFLFFEVKHYMQQSASKLKGCAESIFIQQTKSHMNFPTIYLLYNHFLHPSSTLKTVYFHQRQTIFMYNAHTHSHTYIIIQQTSTLNNIFGYLEIYSTRPNIFKYFHCRGVKL